ncbi:MAG TPA: hypothetical protein VEU95_02995 [Micropepsaceae bacterium]|nr:hypothetical protein [Micropepsaceae bacterium]
MNDDILMKFANKAILRHNEYWSLPAGAIGVIQEAKSQGTPLFGFDGARIDDRFITPSQADSWDYTRISSSIADPYEHAVQFIQERQDTDLRFSVVLGESKEKSN